MSFAWRPQLVSWASVLLVGCSNAEPERHQQDAGLDGSQPSEARHLAHNIIVFMGDGMGAEQIAAARFVAGGQLAMDALAGPALAITDSLTTLHNSGPDALATDSAAAATWIATGVRVENDVLSIAPDGTSLETVLELCKRAGKATGLVTTSTFFDASPAAFTAHQLSRSLSPDIAREMLTATQPDVIMGAGDWLFDDAQHELSAAATQGNYALVRGAGALAAWDAKSQRRMLGLFATDFSPQFVAPEPFTMTPALERTEASPDPSLLTMTQRAIERLARDPDGFFLFAEDEITDEIGHSAPADVAWANRALPAEVAAIDAAVAYAIAWTQSHSSFDETLIVVLADHETGGYRFDHQAGPASGEFSAHDGTSGLHTRTPIEVRARGPGSEAIEQIVSHGDTHRLLVGTLRR
ncbi:MAG TPA: alkaline phosphatase [Polyangiales bacterium]|nr:alkaline phosphatase [Polyangiales bacterium]